MRSNKGHDWLILHHKVHDLYPTFPAHVAMIPFHSPSNGDVWTLIRIGAQRKLS
jgi:hypothetical protein